MWKRMGLSNLLNHLNRLIVGLMVENTKHDLFSLSFNVVTILSNILSSLLNKKFCHIFSLFWTKIVYDFHHSLFTTFFTGFFCALHFIKLLLCWFAILLGSVVGKKQLKTAVPQAWRVRLPSTVNATREWSRGTRGGGRKRRKPHSSKHNGPQRGEGKWGVCTKKAGYWVTPIWKIVIIISILWYVIFKV